MKNNIRLIGIISSMLLIFSFVCCAKNNSRSTPSDGTYTFDPRPQATSAGQPVAAYLDKVTVKNGYTTFFLTSVPDGKGDLSDIPGYWGTGSSKGKVILL